MSWQEAMAEARQDELTPAQKLADAYKLCERLLVQTKLADVQFSAAKAEVEPGMYLVNENDVLVVTEQSIRNRHGDEGPKVKRVSIMQFKDLRR